MAIKKIDYEIWLQNPVTKEVFQVLRDRQETIAEGFNLGSLLVGNKAEALDRLRELCNNSNDYQMLWYLGQIYEMEMLLGMTFEDMKIEEG